MISGSLFTCQRRIRLRSIKREFGPRIWRKASSGHCRRRASLVPDTQRIRCHRERHSPWQLFVRVWVPDDLRRTSWNHVGDLSYLAAALCRHDGRGSDLVGVAVLGA